MKPTLKCWVAALWLLLGLNTLAALGQTSAQCPITSTSPVSTDFATWNWEYDLTDNNYCKTWTARLSGGQRVFLGAPWAFGRSPSLVMIGNQRDFLKVNGWELLRLDFGGNSNAVADPYFILYNKYTGTLRVFVYVIDPNNYSQVLMKMQYGSINPNSRSTAVGGLSNSLLVAPDKYLQHNGVSDDLTTYVCTGYGGGSGWVYGEFTMLFDPNVGDARYYESALQFELYGVTNSTLAISGSQSFRTMTEGYGLAGKTSMEQPGTVSGTKKFLGQGAKLLGKVSSWRKEIENINKSATDASKSLASFNSPTKQPLYAAYKLATFVGNQTGDDSKAAGAVKGILSFAGKLGGFFSLAGTVIGTLWPDANQTSTAPPPAPTISTGTIKLTGEIQTSAYIARLTMQVPGTPHNTNLPNTPGYNPFAWTTQPYYDCPMGLFNLAATPRLEQVVYNRAQWFHRYRSASFTSYRGQALQPVVNQAANMEVISVQAAIMQKVPYSLLATDFSSDGGIHLLNFVRTQVTAGALEVAPYDSGDPALNIPDDDVFLVHTPFVDAGCFAQVSYNARTSDLAASPAFVRVIATLRRRGASVSTAPIYFVQDYAADVFDSPNPPHISSNPINVGPMNTTIAYPYAPFVNMDAGVPFGLHQGYLALPVATFKNQVTPGPNIVHIASNIFPDLTVLPNTLYPQQVAGEFRYREIVFDPSSEVDFNWWGTTTARAGNGISFQGTLAVPAGNTFSATTELVDDLVCPPVQQAVGVGPTNCTYNTLALRPAGTTALTATPSSPGATQGVRLAPNPAAESTTAELVGDPTAFIQQAQVLTLSGQVAWTQTLPAERRLRRVTIPLAGINPGLYVVRLVSTTRTYASKLQIN